MPLRDRADRFGGLSIFNHWVLAVLIVGMLTLGLVLEEMPKGDLRNSLMFIHKSVGVLVLFLACWRVLWRLVSGFPDEVAEMRAWQRLIAKAVHYALLACGLLMPLSGYIASSASGHPVEFFGLFAMPSLPENKALGDFAFETHEVVATLLMVLIGLHVLAALKHHFLDRDDTLRRMLRSAGRS